MKQVIINTDGIKENEIDESATRAKALMINSNNEILLGYGFGAYQFIGGHVNDNESITEGLKREIEEETGIIIEDDDLKPFMKIIHYTRNYRNTGKNRENIIFYYYIKNEKGVNKKKVNYDEWERAGKFTIKKVKMNDLEKVLLESASNSEMNQLIVEEMLEVIKEYKKVLIEN